MDIFGAFIFALDCVANGVKGVELLEAVAEPDNMNVSRIETFGENEALEMLSVARFKLTEGADKNGPVEFLF